MEQVCRRSKSMDEEVQLIYQLINLESVMGDPGVETPSSGVVGGEVAEFGSR